METWIQRPKPKSPRVRKGKDKRFTWILLGSLAIIVKTYTAQRPDLIEVFYTDTAFVFIRSILDNTVGRLDFPVLYLVIPYMFFSISRVYIRGIASKGGCILRFFNFLYSTLASALWIVFWFTLLWGLNYNRAETHEVLNLSPTQITNAELFQEVDARVQDLIPLRESLKPSNQLFQDSDLPDDIENIIRAEVMETMSLIYYHQPKGRVRIRHLNPPGILLRFGTAGFYFPFTGECNIDSGLHPLQKPFTMAHEMAHGYGIGNEATCNFIAYLACMRSDHEMIRYSGMLSFWRYLAGSYRSNNNDIYTEYRKNIHPGIVADLDDINRNNELYPDIFPWLREAAYDSYLKSQGEADGIASYGKVVELVLGLEAQYPEHRVLLGE